MEHKHTIEILKNNIYDINADIDFAESAYPGEQEKEKKELKETIKQLERSIETLEMIQNGNPSDGLSIKYAKEKILPLFDKFMKSAMDEVERLNYLGLIMIEFKNYFHECFKKNGEEEK